MNAMTQQRVVVAGSSGLIGSALVASLSADGAEVVRLVRRPARAADEVEWLTDGRPLDPGVLDGADAVVGLNGASIARLPWTSGYRRTLHRSRIEPARVLATALARLGAGAPAFLSGSAVGIYGDRPGERLDESSATGSTFLAGLCQEWEAAARAVAPHSRVVLLRTAPLLHRRGVLRPMLTLTRLGLAGPLGSGRQIWPWISLDDEVRAIRHLIGADIDGAVNLCGPVPATANDIGRGLARAMHRPYLLPAPAWALRTALGDAADSLLLPDADVRPRALIDSGFVFAHETYQQALTAELAD